jgi:uncharacterized glyoxalase superfamily protein PhnB
MHAHANEPSATIVPTLRYRNVAAAIDWLCNAFGFARHLVVPGEDGSVRYAELTFGNGMIMLGPVEGSAFDGLMTQPDDAGGAETQICYLFVDDAASHRARAKAAGAEIVLDIEEKGGRGYSCRDLEGHIWNFGTYDPWKRRSAEAPSVAAPARRRGTFASGLKRVALVSGLLLCVVASVIVVDWASGHREPAPGRTDGSAAVQETLARERWAREAAERSNRAAREQAGHERQAREVAERTARDAQASLAQERSAREAAERAAREAREQLARFGGEQAAREMREMREQLVRERGALEAAQRVAREAREQLALTERAAEALRSELAAERSARQAVERAIEPPKQPRDGDQSLREDAERNKQAREKAAKERAAKEAAERAANEAAERATREARERRQQAVRRSEPSEPVAAASMPTPFTGRSEN